MSRADVDRLAALLEADPADAPEGEDRQLTLLASALRQAAPEPVAMRAEARSELRAQVLRAAREQKAEAPLLTRMRERVERMRYSAGFATGTGVAAMTLSMGGVAGAAELAGPGDLLYGVKLQIEDARLALTRDDVARGERAVSYAFDRLDEATAAAQDGRDADAAHAIDGATDRMAEGTDHLVAAGLTDPLRQLSADVDAQQQLLQDLRPLLGADGLAAADALSAQLDATGEALAGSLLLDPVDPIAPAPRPDVVVPSMTATPVPDTGLPSATPVPVDPSVDARPGTADGPVTVPGLPLPGLPTPALPPLPVPPPTQPLPTSVPETVDGIVEDVGQTVDGVLDAVTGTVGEVLPAPVGPAVPQIVDGVADGVADTVSDTLGTVDDTVDGLAGDGLSGLLGGG